MLMIWLLLFLLSCAVLAYFGVALPISIAVLAVILLLGTLGGGLSSLEIGMWLLFLVVFVTLNIPALRVTLISRSLFNVMRRAMPSISQTERDALEAGNVWWDAELFSGNPRWDKLLGASPAKLSKEEQAFVDGPVEQLCQMLDDWDITAKRRDLPEEAWDFIKKNKFLGMIIPKKYGGLEFSAFAHSEVVMKISSRSISAAVSVMVPNSLGPAELLLRYGAEEQKDHYLPRLAVGEEVPCFALTAPSAGSDAGAIPDEGIVCHGKFDGKNKVLGIRLNWDKRYITLSPVATVLGIAFKLYDPDGLLGETEDIGITVALIPANTPGVSTGNRHFPLNGAFQNGPTRGKDVFIPMDWVIGGAEQVGNGWRMLMECLADGRAISLPALSTGGGKVASRVTGAYARVRRQFNLPIGHFEGVEEPLARIGGNTYIMDAARQITSAALDRGEKPSVISAILKYELTERMRRAVNDAMDIQGGSGICLGPSNFLGRIYQTVPISITVEGANILTRSLIIFGQGAVRCHPYIQKEIEAFGIEDQNKAVEMFDEAMFSHIGFFAGNVVRAFWLAVTNARFSHSPGDQRTRDYFRQINRLSAAFALTADTALITLGGLLKRKERLSGRFADVLSNLYLASTVLKHYQDQGCQEADLPLVDYACRTTIYRAQQSLLAVFWNLHNRPLAIVLRSLLFPFGKPYSPPHDLTIHAVARLLLSDSPSRDRLTRGIYINEIPGDATGRIEYAFKSVLAAEAANKTFRKAVRSGELSDRLGHDTVAEAVKKKIVSKAEAKLIRTAEEATRDAVSVDEFPPGELSRID